MSTGSALTIIVPLVAGKQQALGSLLTDVGEHIQTNSLIPFARLTLTHFLRWVLLPPAAEGGTWQLAFECNHDGSPEQLLEELLTQAPLGLHRIYQHCVGYPLSTLELPRGDTDTRAALRYLLAHRLPYSAFYVGSPGLSVRQIRGQEQLRQHVERSLDRQLASAHGSSKPSALALCRRALAELRTDPALSSLLDLKDDGPAIHPARLVAGVLAAVLASPTLLAGLAAIGVKELFDKQSPSLAVPDEARALMAREDLQIQNQLTHIVPLKPGALRAASTRVVLGAIDFLAHALFTQGQLGGISSIHFARWVIIDDGARLLFFSNYDGSWESYLGDFIDKAAVGLTAVWSNTELFPDTHLLVLKGARDEERFKAWTRAHQVTTQLWYSAYPELTVRNIVENRKLCSELQRGFSTEAAAAAWLQHF